MVTVFVPTNAAIALVPNWDEIVADDDAFDSFVRSHLITGAFTADRALHRHRALCQLPTLSGETIEVDPVAQTINGATIVTADTPGTNGIVHTIDALLVVPDPGAGNDSGDDDDRLTPNLVSCRCRFLLAGLTNPVGSRRVDARVSSAMHVGRRRTTADLGRVTHLRPNR